MKFLIIFILTFSLYSQEFSIELKGMDIGKIDDITTIKKGYLKAKAKNFLVRIFLGEKYLILYDDRFTKNNQKNIKYKKDSHKILFLISYVLNNEISKKPFKIDISSQKYIIARLTYDVNNTQRIDYDYYSKNKLKSKGYVETHNKTFEEFVNITNGIKITKI
ncbi:MAG: Unknown protein [uncultured Campylobacterales bacterium]|uniref:Uncharacterized protein n=1 Tax=uncultured Campylobacterales bacterium TaxID=352960 RepID=A0A6S6RYQ0_9BACT|nr:MAG: Unknown protein [uncultured Campylobacterales bacterium]